MNVKSISLKIKGVGVVSLKELIDLLVLDQESIFSCLTFVKK